MDRVTHFEQRLLDISEPSPSIRRCEEYPLSSTLIDVSDQDLHLTGIVSSSRFLCKGFKKCDLLFLRLQKSHARGNLRFLKEEETLSEPAGNDMTWRSRYGWTGGFLCHWKRCRDVLPAVALRMRRQQARSEKLEVINYNFGDPQPPPQCNQLR